MEKIGAAGVVISGWRGGELTTPIGDAIGSWGLFAPIEDVPRFQLDDGIELPTALWVTFMSPSLGVEGLLTVNERHGLMRVATLAVAPVEMSDGGDDVALSLDEALGLIPAAALMREAVKSAAGTLAGSDRPSAGFDALRALHRRRQAIERIGHNAHLYWVAAYYKDEIAAAAAEGRRAAPVEAVMAHFEGKSRTTISRWIRECRQPEVGFLPPTTRGRANA